MNSQHENQRLSREQLQAWEQLGYGMFIHFGMSTYVSQELPDGKTPLSMYAPDKLDVDQWVSVARDAGMKYAVLTAKHVAGHCLWPSAHTDYHVGNSTNTENVVEQFVNACEKRGIMPGLYYCSWDNHHRFGSITPSTVFNKPPGVSGFQTYTTQAYEEFQTAQLEELLTQYGKIGEVWIDIPGVLSRDYRHRLYNDIRSWQPETAIIMNHGIGDGSQFLIDKAWPTDIIPIERFLPNSMGSHQKIREIDEKEYYLPGEVCEPIGQEWFYVAEDKLRSDQELLGMYLVARARETNMLLDVPPDKHGLIPAKTVDALMRLRKNLDLLNY